MEIKKYAVVAFLNSGPVMINRKGGAKGYDTLEEAKAVAKEHNYLGVPIGYGPMENLVKEDGTISFGKDAPISESLID